jgi:hypothetical protein
MRSLNKIQSVSLWLFFAVAIFFRIWTLSWTPGINADESWYGLVTHQILDGQSPWWFTPNGNLINPLFLAPHLILAAMFPPDFFALRLPAALYGILTVWVAWQIGRVLFGRAGSWGMAITVAALPMAIAYSRISWDPAMSLLVDLIFLFSCARLSAMGLPVSVAAILIVHPTNIFLLPAGGLLALYAAALRRFRLSVVTWIGAVLSLGVFAVIWIYVPAFHTGQGLMHGGHLSWSGLQSINRFVWGLPAYFYVVGSVKSFWVDLADFVGAAVLYGGIAVGLLYFALHKRWQPVVYLGVFVATLLITLLVVGHSVFEPDSERYGLFALAPLAMAMGALCEAVGKKMVIALWAIGSVLLVGFYANYFEPLHNRGSDAHRTFHSADPEPRQQAYDLLTQAALGNTLVCSDYWICMPLMYLDSGHKHFRFVEIDQVADPVLALSQAFEAGGAAVLYAGSIHDLEAHAILSHRRKFHQQPILDAGGRRWLRVYW